jgi:hypothetical protein
MGEEETKSLLHAHLGLLGQGECAYQQEAQTWTVDCVFLGYAIHSVGYRFLIINSEVPDMHVGTIMESRDATFFENEFPMKTTPSTTGHESVIPHKHEHEHEMFTPVQQIEEPYEQNPEEDNIVVTRKSKR